MSVLSVILPLSALAIQMSRGASSQALEGGGDLRSRWLIVMFTSADPRTPSAFELPMTAGPELTLVVQRIGVANRTAKPSSVVLPDWTLMAVVQAGSAGPCWNTR